MINDRKRFRIYLGGRGHEGTPQELSALVVAEAQRCAARGTRMVGPDLLAPMGTTLESHQPLGFITHDGRVFVRRLDLVFDPRESAEDADDREAKTQIVNSLTEPPHFGR